MIPALGRLSLTVIAILVICFSLLALSPVDPVSAYLGYGKTVVSESQRLLIVEQWHLDQTLFTRFFDWLMRFVRGDWGWSLTFNAPVTSVISNRLGLSLPLIATAWGLSTLMGLLLGMAAGFYQGRVVDQVIRGFSWFNVTMPGYWIAMLLLLVFALRWPILPAGGVAPPGMLATTVGTVTAIKYRILPVAALTFTALPAVILHGREKMVALMESKTLLYARAQGAGVWDILFYHGLHHTTIPVLTFQLAALGELIGGSLLIEQVFSWPGLGQAAVQAGLYADIPLLMAIVVLAGVVVCLGNFLADGINRLMDVRVAEKGCREC
ncbi:ABC transporter permease [Endozoicomonas sp. Mp262]|uniref:ABC transporter permease n=1 Tax=Endozoicomonas sp. Mp262 TaxID=2919499 RepID=UPI0021D91386